MKTTKNFTILILIILYVPNLIAQPFTLDKKIIPIKLQLTEHPKFKGAKYIEGSLTVKQDSINYHFVKGHDVFQFVDIFIFPNDAKASLQAAVVYNTWSNIEETQKTSTSKNGYINFKVRSYQDIGFTVTSKEHREVPYTIVVNASPEVKNYLGSPFIKATEKNMSLETSAVKTDASPLTQNNLWIYIIIGVLILIIGLLAGKLLGGKKIMSMLLILVFSSMYTFGQTVGIENARQSNLETEIFHRRERNAINATINAEIDASIARYNQAYSIANSAEKYLEEYRNLGSCLGSVAPAGQPRIPSFCGDEDSSCADCFRSARAEFNRTRYNLEKLQTIYNCSKAYTDAAIALGDNASGVHGVVGLVWQSQRRQIIRSVEEVDKAYDKKRVEMLQSFHASLIELDKCEQSHGLEDWYDRFGVMFYNFVEMRYHR